MEDRILHSASGLVGGLLDNTPGSQSLGGAPLVATAQQWLLPAKATPSTLAQAAAPDTNNLRQELVFVDATLPDAQGLLAGINADGVQREIVWINAGSDGLALINQTLAGRHGVDAVHLVTHGSAASLQLGSTTLDAAQLMQSASDIAGWADALGERADLLLYGCDLAADEAGRQLLQDLAALTGADVAASTNATGSAALGGDWVLEQQLGPLETPTLMAQAGATAWAGVLSNDIPVNTTLSNNQSTDALNRGSQQAVAIDAAGNYVVVWTDGNANGGNGGIVARRFSFDGTPLTPELPVSTTTGGAQSAARVVGDSTGNFTVAWTSEGQDGEGSAVVWRRFAADGTALSAEVRANVTTAGDQQNPVIARNAVSGDFVVAWQGAGPGDSAGIFFRRFNAAGTALDATEMRANLTDAGTEIDPAVAMDSAGRVVVAFEVGNHMYFQRFDPAGVAAGGRTQVDNALSNSARTSIAMDAAGNFTLAYREEGSLAPGVWGRGYLADGSQRYTWFYADTGDATDPSIAMDASGNFVLAYTKTGSDGTDVLARRYNADGSASGAAFTVNQTTAGDQGQASVALVDINNYVVAWSGATAADGSGVAARSMPGAVPAITSDGGGTSASLSVVENTSLVTTVVATDADPGDTPRYRIVGGADAALFNLDSSTGALRFVTAPDYESPADSGADNVYNVTVEARDQVGQTDTQALAVTVTDYLVSDVLLATQDTWLNNTSKSNNYGQSASLTLDKSGGGIGNGRVLLQFDLAAIPFGATVSSAQLVMNATQNGGALNIDVYRLTAPWTEGSGDGTAGPANWDDRQAGIAWSSAGSDYAAAPVASLNTGATGLHQWDLTALTQSWVSGVQANQGVVLGSPDTGGSTVTYDSAEGAYAPRLLVTFSPVNEPPVITTNGGGAAASLSVPENSTAVTTVGADDTTPVTYSLAGGADAALFSINATTGVLQFANAPNFEAPADVDANNIYQVVVQASDGSLTDSQTLDITVTNVAEQPTSVADVYNLTEDQAFTASVASGWYDAAWSTRQFISLNNTTGAPLSNTAVLVTLDAATVDYSRIQNAGQDLRFVDADGGLLDYQIDTWNPGAVSQVWVRVPSVSATSGSDGVWMYYGNSAAPAAQDAGGVWADARAVLHMDTSLTDSAVPANPVTQANTTVSVSGIGSARLFNGTSSIVSLGSAAAVDDLFAGGGAVSAWIYPTGWGEAGFGRIASKASTTTASAGWALQLDGANQSLLFENGFTGQVGRWRTPAGSISLNTWQHVAVVYDSSSSSTVPTVYINGVAVALTTSSTPAGAPTSDAALSLTVGSHTTASQRTFAGGIDEFRAYGTARTAAQIQAENLSGNRSLASLGAVQTASPGVLNNDVNEDGGALSAVLASGPAHAASFSLRPDGSFDYTPAADYNGSDSFSYVPYNGTLAGSVTTVTLNIAAVNDAPVITSNGGGSSAAITVSENSTAVTTVEASDVDVPAPTLAYSITGGTDASRFAVNTSTGVLSFVAAPDFEAPADANADNVYQVTVQASDGLLSDSQTLTVTVTPVNDRAPVITSNGGGATASLNGAENTSVVTTVVAGDADLPAQALVYSIAGGADAARFAINPTTGVLSFTAAPDHELPADTDANNLYEVTVQVSDGALTDTQTLAVTVTDTYENPVAVDDSADTTVNTPVVVDVLANDRLTDGTGQYLLDVGTPQHGQASAVAGGVHYTPAPGYIGSDVLNYRISDGSDGLTHYWRLDGDAIDVLGSADGTLVNGPASSTGRWGNGLAFNGVNQSVTLPDLTYSNAFSLSLWFRMDDNNGSSYRYLYAHGTAAAANSVNVFFIENSTATGTGVTGVLRTRLRDSNDTDNVSGLDIAAAPLADGQWHQYTLTVGSGVGSKVYIDGVLQASISNGGGTINPSGNAMLGGNNVLDSTRLYQGDLDGLALFNRELSDTEVVAQYSGGGSTATAKVDLSVLADNTAPVISSNGGGATADIRVNENVIEVTKVTASDADLPAQNLLYSIAGGADAARFGINPTTGVLSFLAAPDFEAPVDHNLDNVYEVTVQASDGLLADQQALTVTVGDVGGALTVSTTADTVDGDVSSVEALLANLGADGQLSLREALTAANNTAGLDQIVLPAGFYALDRVGAEDDLNTTGDLDVLDDLRISGAGAASTSISGADQSRVLQILAGDTSVLGVTIRDGVAAGSAGAGVAVNSGASLTISQSVISGNIAGLQGGGISNAGSLTLTDVEIRGNTSSLDGGGIHHSGTRLDLSHLTLADNLAMDGGGLYAVGAAQSLRNVTVSGNAAQGTGGGLNFGTAASLLNVTVANNTGINGGTGGVFTPGSATVTLRNVLLADNSGGNVNTASGLVSLGNNLSSDTVTAFNQGSDLNSANAALGPLADNGGFTRTHALLSASAAIDAGDTASAPATDQRNNARVGSADIGAYESAGSANQPPVNHLAAAPLIQEDTPTPITSLWVNDADAGGGDTARELAQVQLSVSQGRLSLLLAGGASISAGADNSSTLTLIGSQSAINASLSSLQYTGAPDFVGTDTLMVVSQDGNGLSDSDSLVLNVLPVNDAPQGSDRMLDLTEDTPVVLGRANFGYADTAGEGNALASVLLSPPTAGSLSLQGQGLTADTEVTAAQLDAGALVYLPPPNANGIALANLPFQVRDDGGTANGGIDLDPVVRTLTLNVVAVNDPPAVALPLANQTVTEDVPFSLALPPNSFTDIDVGDVLSLSATLADGSPLPSWLVFDTGAATFSGTADNTAVGTVNVRVTATDLAGDSASSVWVLAVRNANDAPTLVSPLPDGQVTEDLPFSLTLPAASFADVDAGDVLGWQTTLASGLPLPGWLSFDPGTRQLNGTATNSDVGALTLRVTVTDPAGATASDDLVLQVSNANDAPTAGPALADQLATEDLPFDLTLAATAFDDVDAGDVLTWSATQADGAALPAWLSFDADTRHLTGTPGNSDVGLLALRFTVTDTAGARASLPLALTVLNVNDAPALVRPLPDLFATQDQALGVDLPVSTFADVDSADAMLWSARQADGSPLPAWLTFDSDTRSLSGTPANADVGALNLRITATDLAGASASAPLLLTVLNVNDAPTLDSPLADQSAQQGSRFDLALPVGSFTDIDAGDSLRYRATLASGEALPAWLSFDGERLIGTPENADVGPLALRITAADNAGATATADFNLVVANVNDHPQLLAPIADSQVRVDETYRFTVAAGTFADPDTGDSLQLGAQQADGSPLPAWLRFDPATNTFTGTPGPADVARIRIVLTAADSSGATAQTTFAITVQSAAVTATIAEPPPAPEPAAPAASASDLDAEPNAESTDEPVPAAAQPPVFADTLSWLAAAAMPTPATVTITVLAPETATGLRSAAPAADRAELLKAAAEGAEVAAARPAAAQLPSLSLSNLLESDAVSSLSRPFEALQRQLLSQDQRRVAEVVSTAAVTGGLSVGYVVWLVRGGVLMSSMLSALPVWQMVDPMPVLASQGGGSKGGDDDDGLERLFDGQDPAQGPGPAPPGPDSLPSAHAPELHRGQA